MTENETVLEENKVQPELQPEPVKPSRGKRIGGAIKEWFRKFTVKLKRRPMNIAFFVLVVSSLVYLFLLGNFSRTGLEFSSNGVPISMFVNTLFCILVLLLFMYSFPKRAKKPKVVMLVLTFVFMVVLIGLDIHLHIQWSNGWNEMLGMYANNEVTYDDILVRTEYIYGAIDGVLAHAVLVLIAAVLTATYPLYGKLIGKINTRKVIESTEIKEEIDTSEE